MVFNEFKGKFPSNLNSDTVIMSFYVMLRFDFISKLKYMSEKISYGAESYGYNFPDIFDPDDGDYREEGVEFWVGETGEIVSVEEYHEYLKTHAWRKKRAEALEFHGAVCNHCGSEADLHVHHQTYAIIYHEHMEDFVILCNDCHKKEHAYLKKHRNR